MKYPVSVEHESDELPIDLDFIKQHFNISPNQTDSYVKNILKIALKSAETYTDRSIIMKRWCYRNKQTRIHLPKAPINKILSVSIQTPSGFEETKDFKMEVHNEYRIITLNQKTFDKEVKVIYEAGFTKENLPTSILQFVLLKFDDIYHGNNENQMNDNRIPMLDMDRDMSFKI